MFPLGWPGIGLLLLRSSVAIALLAEGYSHRRSLPGWLQGAAILFCLTVLAGYGTPIAAAIGLLLHCLLWLRFGSGCPASVIIVSLDVMALALLGPGGYSVDATQFGRRVVTLPPS
jgi:hypothetical protein